MLKYEGFKIGDKIKAYDFEPMEGRDELYVIGEIVAIDEEMFKGYVIKPEIDTMFPEEPREEGKVPMEVMMMEYDGRIEKVEE